MAKSFKTKLAEAARNGDTQTVNSPALWEATTDKLLVAAQADANGMVLTFEHPNGQRTIQRV